MFAGRQRLVGKPGREAIDNVSARGVQVARWQRDQERPDAGIGHQVSISWIDARKKLDPGASDQFAIADRR